MDKKKKSARKSSAPKMKDLDVKQRRLAIIKQKQCDAIALHIVRKLIDGSVEDDVFLQSLKYLNQCHYQDIVEERAIGKLCGYPVCGNEIKDMPSKKFHISTKTNKVYDITDRKNYCSNFCYKAGSYIKDQMLTSPLWFRDKEEIPDFHLLPKTESGVPGEEIDQGIIKLDVDEDQNFTSISKFTQDMINEIPENIYNIQENISVGAKETAQKEDVYKEEIKEVANDKLEKENVQDNKSEINQYFMNLYEPTLADILRENAEYFSATVISKNSTSKSQNTEISALESDKDNIKNIVKEDNTEVQTKLVENKKENNKFESDPCTSKCETYKIGFNRTVINTESKGILKKFKRINSEKKHVSFSTNNSVHTLDRNEPESLINYVVDKPERTMSDESIKRRYKQVNLIGTVQERSSIDKFKTTNLIMEPENKIELPLNNEEKLQTNEINTDFTINKEDVTENNKNEEELKLQINITENIQNEIHEIKKELLQINNNTENILTEIKERIENVTIKNTTVVSENNKDLPRNGDEKLQINNNSENNLNQIKENDQITNNKIKKVMSETKIELPPNYDEKLQINNNSENNLNEIKENDQITNNKIKKVMSETKIELPRNYDEKLQINSNSENNLNQITNNKIKKVVSETKLELPINYDEKLQINSNLISGNIQNEKQETTTNKNEKNMTENKIEMSQINYTENLVQETSKEKRLNRLKNSSVYKKTNRLSKASSLPTLSNLPDLKSRINTCLSEWFTFETLLFLYGEDQVKKITSEKTFKQYYNNKKNIELDDKKQKQYEEICKRLSLMELADQKFDESVTGKKRRPLPRYDDLRQSAEHMDLRVQAFYAGCYEMYEDDVDTDTESVGGDEPQDKPLVEQGPPAVLPLVDNKDVMATRKRIFQTSVSRAMSTICEILQESPNRLLAEIKHLINTFEFTATNIVFKTTEWQFVTLLLIQILAIRDKELQNVLASEEISQFMSSLAEQFGLPDTFILDMLSNIQVHNLLDKCMKKDCIE